MSVLLLPPAHRLARINYLVRTAFFGYLFLVIATLASERGSGAWELLLAAVTFLAYPQLAYLHARIAVDSKRAEFNNLSADSVLTGMWVAQFGFALWPTCGVLVATSLNNASCGNVKGLVRGFLLFVAGAGAWAALSGFRFVPGTGAVVTGLCLAGILVYASTMGIIFFQQNKRLVRTRDVLRKSEQQFRFIAEHAGDLVSVLDAEGRIRYASPSHGEYFEPGSLAEGQEWLGLVHPDDRARAKEFLGLLAVSLHSERIQLRMSSAKGPRRVVECEGNCVPDESGGKSKMIVLTSRDLTARARAEIDIRLAARAFDHLADPVLISDDTGGVEFVNKAYTDVTGYASEELVGRSLHEFEIGAKPADLLGEIWKTVEREGNWRGKFVERAKDGRLLPLTAQVSAIRDRRGVAAHYVWIIGADPDSGNVRAASGNRAA